MYLAPTKCFKRALPLNSCLVKCTLFNLQITQFLIMMSYACVESHVKALKFFSLHPLYYLFTQYPYEIE